MKSRLAEQIIVAFIGLMVALLIVTAIRYWF